MEQKYTEYHSCVRSVLQRFCANGIIATGIRAKGHRPWSGWVGDGPVQKQMGGHKKVGDAR
eukprot:1539438-Amphidinium_carterae.1